MRTRPLLTGTATIPKGLTAEKGKSGLAQQRDGRDGQWGELWQVRVGGV